LDRPLMCREWTRVEQAQTTWPVINKILADRPAPLRL